MIKKLAALNHFEISEELLKKSAARISALSDTWHEEEFANQDVGGEYTKGIEDEDAEQEVEEV